MGFKTEIEDRGGEVDEIRKQAAELVIKIDMFLPVSEDKTRAMVKIEESIMWLNKAINKNKK